MITVSEVNTGGIKSGHFWELELFRIVSLIEIEERAYCYTAVELIPQFQMFHDQTIKR